MLLLVWVGCLKGISNMASGNIDASKKFKGKFFKFLRHKNLQLCQVFNADKTGLNYKILPKRTLSSKLDSVTEGHKVNKESLTLLSCNNAFGNPKIPI